jgi:hypothetical protein
MNPTELDPDRNLTEFSGAWLAARSNIAPGSPPQLPSSA